MNLIVRKNDKVVQKIIQNYHRKAKMLTHDKVIDSLNEVEIMVAQSGVVFTDEIERSRKPLKALTEEEITSEVSETIGFIVRDIGIKNWGGADAAYETTRFIKFIRTYYGNLNYKEVELAFELLCAGKLDEYLSNPNGNKSISHYQSFSIEYVGKVIESFKSFKKDVWVKVHKNRPTEQTVLSEKVKKNNIQSIINDVAKKYDQHQKGGSIDFMLPTRIVELFQEKGLITDIPPISQKEKEAAFHDLVNDILKNAYDKESIKKKYKSGDCHQVNMRAKRELCMKLIIQVFDNMSKEELMKNLS